MDKQVESGVARLRQTRRSLPMALLRAREAVMENFRPMLASLKVTEQQWRVLRVLAEAESIDATEVAKRAAILAPSLTRIVRLLEKRKLLRRRKDKVDKRRVILEIAPHGLELIARGAPQSQAVHKLLEERFGQDRLNTLLDLLAEVTSAAETAQLR